VLLRDTYSLTKNYTTLIYLLYNNYNSTRYYTYIKY